MTTNLTATGQARADSGEFICVELQKTTSMVTAAVVQTNGCPDLLAEAETLRLLFAEPISIECILKKYPRRQGKGSSHARFLASEALYRALGLWQPEVTANKVVCPCLKMKAKEIDAAIVAGDHCLQAIKRRLVSGGKCTRCHGRLHQLLDYRICGHSAAQTSGW